MTDREIMQMALDALEEAKENVMDWGSYASEYFQTKHGLAQDILALENISEALRARLAQPEWIATTYVGDGQRERNVYYDEATQQPEPEPVAWISAEETWLVPKLLISDTPKDGYKPVYTAPPQRECKICGKVAKP